jgi:predicted RNase H-like HicB family nuclease
MNTRYEVVISWSDDDDCFIADVPELPGCMADGPTHQEAASNAETAIREWLDTATQLGRPIPQPKRRIRFA